MILSFNELNLKLNYWVPIGLKPKIVIPDSPSVIKLPTVAMAKLINLINSNKDSYKEWRNMTNWETKVKLPRFPIWKTSRNLENQ